MAGKRNYVNRIAALKAEGHAVGDAGDFLGLSDVEREQVDLDLAVTRAVQTLRKRTGLTQAALARRIGSSQSRVAMIESGSIGVSLDLAFKALFAAGGTLGDVMTELSELKRRSAELRKALDAAEALSKKRLGKKSVAK